MKSNYNFWYEPYLRCENTQNYFLLQNNYCFNSKNTKIPFKGKIIENNGIYGVKNLYCLWNIENIEPKKEIIININRKKIDSSEKLFIKLIYNNNSEENIFFENERINYSKNNISKITIRYFSKEEKTYNPININIKYKKEKNNLLLSGIIISVIFVFILSICFCFWWHAKTMKKKIDNIMNEKNIDMSQYYIECKYEESKNLFKTNCMICLLNFNPGEDILILLCNHIFHKKCLEKWFDDSNKEKKCPNCNLKMEEILVLKKKIEPKKIIISNTNKKINNISQSNEQLNPSERNLILSSHKNKKLNNKTFNRNEIIIIQSNNLINEDGTERSLK